MAKAPRSLVAQVIAITGGARGIGRATAEALIAQGARVAIGDIDADVVQQTAAELGSGTLGLTVDVTDRESFATFLDTVDRDLGPLDALINNAGIMPVGPFLDENDSCADRILAINVTGVIYGSKLALARFVPRRRGHLVNIASVAGKAGAAGGATYCASKHAVVGLTESLNQEFHGSGIDFTVVLPIGVNTELYSGMTQIRGFKTPEPQEVAAAIVGALQRPRFEVYVPKSMQPAMRSTVLLPHRAQEAVSRFLRVDRALTGGDKSARSAYLERMDRTIGGRPAVAGQPAGDAAPSPAAPDAGEGEPEPAGAPAG